jgi:hypothetical protein
MVDPHKSNLIAHLNPYEKFSDHKQNEEVETSQHNFLDPPKYTKENQKKRD